MTNERPAPRGRPFQSRAEASYRLPPFGCGHADPWSADHHRRYPTEKQIDSYKMAIEHLDAHGLPPAPLLPELRLLWQRGGNERRTAQSIVQRWELAG